MAENDNNGVPAKSSGDAAGGGGFAGDFGV